MSNIPWKVGDRVGVTGTVDRFPHFLFEWEKERGTVDHIDEREGLVYVKMDQHFEELDEWSNCVEFTAEYLWDAVNRPEADEELSVVDPVDDARERLRMAEHRLAYVEAEVIEAAAEAAEATEALRALERGGAR